MSLHNSINSQKVEGKAYRQGTCYYCGTSVEFNPNVKRYVSVSGTPYCKENK